MNECGCRDYVKESERSGQVYPEVLPDSTDEPLTAEAASEEIGFTAKVAFDPALYTDDDVEAVLLMIMRTVEAWQKRRAFMLAHPDLYGIAVN